MFCWYDMILFTDLNKHVKLLDCLLTKIIRNASMYVICKHSIKNKTSWRESVTDSKLIRISPSKLPINESWCVLVSRSFCDMICSRATLKWPEEGPINNETKLRKQVANKEKNAIKRWEFSQATYYYSGQLSQKLH